MNDQELKLVKDDLRSAARKMLDFFPGDSIFLFDAEMGAGKTTFIKALCEELGSRDHFSSPTYSVINEYESPAGKIYHFDLYRINSVHELLDLGVEEMLDSGAYCFVEWPALMRDLVESDFVGVTILHQDETRLLKATRVSRS